MHLLNAKWLCPTCKSSMEIGDELMLCKKCKVAFDRKNGLQAFDYNLKNKATVTMENEWSTSVLKPQTEIP